MDNINGYDICKSPYYEDITHRHNVAYRKTLSLYELIKIGIENDDYHYVSYLRFRRLAYIKYIIALKTLRLNMLFDDIEQDERFITTKITEDEYTNKLIYYVNRVDKQRDSIDIEDLIEEAYLHLDWPMMFYIYKHEKENIEDYILQEDAKFNA